MGDADRLHGGASGGTLRAMKTVLLPLLLAAAAPASAATYELAATPQTVAWGHYDATSKPVMTVKSGDTVTVHTLLTNSPAGLAKAGVADANIEPALKAVFAGVPQADRGPAGDVEVTELVDRNKGVHVTLAKSLFTGK